MISLLAASLSPATAQLDAPGALSDYSGCTQDGCVWVPEFSKRQIYSRGDLTYSVHETEHPDAATFTLRRGVGVLFSTPLKNLGASVSVAWTAQNDWFSITWSDAGAIGIFHTRIFHLAGDKIVESYAPRAAFADFRSRHRCRERGENIQAYRWDEETGTVVLVMSVYNTGDCGREMGHMEAYFVSPFDGEVLRHLNLTQLQAYMKERKPGI
jgi:hypothetical protein